MSRHITENIDQQIDIVRNVDAETHKPRLQPSVKKDDQKPPNRDHKSKHKPGPPQISISSILLPYLRTPLTGIPEPITSTFVPCAYSMYDIVHIMDDIMRKNSYFRRQEDAWHPLISRLYFGILFHIQILRSELSTGIISPKNRRFLTSFLRDFPPETLVVPGPLAPLFEALNASSPENSLFGKVSPKLHDVVGNYTASQLILYEEGNAFKLLLPYVPGILGFIQNILTAQAAAIPDYTNTNTFDNTADRTLNGHVFNANNWTETERATLLQPGMLYLLETNRDIDTSFNIYGWLEHIDQCTVNHKTANEAHCRLCCTSLRAHISDLRKHATRDKHKKEAAKINIPLKNTLTRHGIVNSKMTTEYTAVANRLLRAASNAASQQTDEENAFESMVSATRRNFRRSDVTVPSPRGRKRRDHFSREALLTNFSHVDFLPGFSEQRYLKNIGLGCYEYNNQSILGEPKNFQLARCNRFKKIYIMENIYNANDLERELGNIREQNSLEFIRHTITSPPNGASPSTNNITQIENTYEDFNFEEVNVNTEINSNLLLLPTLSEDAEEYSLQVSRTNCAYEMFNIYTDKSIVTKRLSVIFSNELGVDGGGLTKELFNIFFKEIESKYFRGEDCLVPFLELNKMKEKDNFIIIGRILEHMLLLTGTIPSKFSKVVLMILADPDKSIDEKLLLDELFSYVIPYLRHILKKSIENFNTLNDKETEIIQDFFQSYNFFELPNPHTYKEQLSLIASEIIIESPRRLVDMLRKGISINKYEFWTKCDFATLLDMQKTTPAKVANCIVSDEDLTQEESRILHYLNMFIRCLSNEDAGLFVFMVTGSFMMPYSINVQFNDLVGLSQRPVFSTCTDTVFLLRSYPSYQDLKNDFNACLQSEDAKIYTSY
ncbi:hypothetical protein RN001_005618 [Aquatica leii]|uniref:HECT domain-containing protein n=1 Tax=Aquatica leii TaxID=1421715 RepID=A0AAN7SIZ2_9COLE|nr:hypothetical protein RN001_005618 [Aquatica leii]